MGVGFKVQRFRVWGFRGVGCEVQLRVSGFWGFPACHGVHQGKGIVVRCHLAAEHLENPNSITNGVCPLTLVEVSVCDFSRFSQLAHLDVAGRGHTEDQAQEPRHSPYGPAARRPELSSARDPWNER